MGNEDQTAQQQLRWAIQALAASAEDQARLFPPSACTACELLGDFENWYGVVVSRDSLGIAAEQRAALDAVKGHIVAMEPTQCFTGPGALERRDWQELRLRAAACLSSFGWAAGVPPSDRSTYVV